MKMKEGKLHQARGYLYWSWPRRPPRDEEMEDFVTSLAGSVAGITSVILDITGSPVPSAMQRKKAAEFWASPASAKYKKLAVVEDQGMKRMVVKIIMAFGKQLQEVKFFKTLAEAEDWVRAKPSRWAA